MTQKFSPGKGIKVEEYYYDKTLKKIQTKGQLKRRGLIKSGINLVKLGILPLFKQHNINTDLYHAEETNKVEIKGNSAFLVYKKKLKDTDLKGVIREKIDSQKKQVAERGFPFLSQGKEYTLQTREQDFRNWFAILSSAQTLPEKEKMIIRVKENKNISIEACKIKNILYALFKRDSSVSLAAASLKDQVAATSSNREAVLIYERKIETIWPDNSTFTP